MTIEQIYARIPAIKCQRKCQGACGPISAFGVEWDRMQAAALVNIGVVGPDLNCPALTGNACSIYEVRPLICRLWGVVREMACPWGCVPERWLSDSEAQKLMRELMRMSNGRIESTVP
jgi:hypothetical protein